MLANEKLMFHSDLLKGVDTGSHIAPKRGKVEDVLSAGTIEEDEEVWASRHNIAATSLKRLVERQAVIKTGTTRNVIWALNKDRVLHGRKRDSVHAFRVAPPSPNQSLESGTKVSATKFLSTEPNRITVCV